MLEQKTVITWHCVCSGGANRGSTGGRDPKGTRDMRSLFCGR